VTQNVFVLFTDLVDSTATSRAMSAEAADQMRREHFSALRQCVAANAGHEVKSLGDGMMVVFDAASSALGCAVAMQQAAELQERQRGNGRTLRIGVSGGEVSVEEDDYFGDPVVEASRLCASCAGGEIRAALVVQLTAGRRSTHAFAPLGPLELKGLDTPLEAVLVGWEVVEGEPRAVIPLPERLRVASDLGVVGRWAELEKISALLAAVREGSAHHALLVAGEPGLGKTTLLAEGSRRAHDDGALVLFGHCEEDAVAPYQLFGEALSHFVIHAPEERLREHVERHRAAIAAIAPVIASRLGELPATRSSDVESERFALFSAVIDLLELATIDAPVLIVLDDLQWADTGSLALMRHVVASDRLGHVAVLASFRDDEVSKSPALLDTLATFHRNDLVERVALSGLDDECVVAMLETAAGHKLEGRSVELARAISHETDGNPFYVREVVRHLAESGAIAQDDEGVWEATAEALVDLPDSVREVIASRVARLGEDAAHALGVAAVIGRDFDLRVLSGAAGLEAETALDVLERAAAVAIVRENHGAPGSFSFVHALIQHTIYEDLGPTRRAMLHRRVAGAIEALGEAEASARVGELARHWSRTAEPGDAGRAVDYARRAGEAALASLAPAEALRHFAAAGELASLMANADEDLVLDIAIGLGRSQHLVGVPESRATLIGAARRALERSDVERLWQAVTGNDRGWAAKAGEIDADMVELEEALLDGLAPEDPRRAHVLAIMVAELTFGSSLERRLEIVAEASDIAQRSGDDLLVVTVANHAMYPLLVPSLLEESRARTADAVARAERVGDPVLLRATLQTRIIDAGRVGDREELETCFARAERIAEELDLHQIWRGETIISCWRSMVYGDIEDATAISQRCLKIGTDAGELDAMTYFGVQTAAISRQRGTLEPIVPLLEGAIADNPGLRGFGPLLAAVYAECDRIDECARMLEGFRRDGFDFPNDVAWASVIVDLCESALACGDHEAGERLLEMLAPLPDQLACIGGATASGPFSHYLAGLFTLLGDLDRADECYARSHAFCEGLGAKYFLAVTQLRWAEALARRGRRGDDVRAAELAKTAVAASDVNGYGTVRRRAGALAERLGV
jgi:class 3 adenylate cyclase